MTTFYSPQSVSFHALPLQPQNPYGNPSAAIDPSPVYLQQLRSMAHPRETLIKNGFVMTPLSDADVVDKKRCRRCNLRCSKAKKFVKSVEQGHKKSPKEPVASKPKENQPSALIALDDKQSKGNETEDKPAKAVLKCQHHTGRVIRAHWNCCQSFVSAPGCTWAPEHLTRDYKPGDLLTRHQLHHTPLSTLLDLTPPPLISVYGAVEATSFTESGLPRHPRRAVAIDCEMGTASDGESELIRLSVVDFFTAEILLDSLVSPAVPMAHYNTRYSGVSRQDMEEARRRGACINGGVAGAREQVWRWVGPETVVVGHGVNNDFASLRWIHPLIIDSLLLASAAKAEKLKREEEEEEERKKAAVLAAAAALSQSGDLMSFDNLESSLNEEGSENSGQAEKDKQRKRSRGGLSLKALTLELLGRHIQVGRGGHDSLEDALAARDLVHWYVMEKMKEKRAQSEHDALLGF
ncbi:3'-5' exonuclease [Colletotrichum plurivorum]|uniref:3'-5' exonuclease n=1 Tax=Colletotrichum plurivorum TaxID=2175906 RepID=A0A8H6KCL0_9PEZI|nr:3'-5' exonuclease [Colletotrichum plurivorum]